MNLAAILNEDHRATRAVYEKSVSNASDSSYDATTPRTPMEYSSPLVCCHSNSPDHRRLRSRGSDIDAFAFPRDAELLSSASDAGYKGVPLFGRHGNPFGTCTSPPGTSEPLSPCSLYNTSPLSDALPSPLPSRARSQTYSVAPRSPRAAGTHGCTPLDWTYGRGERPTSHSGRSHHSPRASGHARLPSVHELFPEQMPAPPVGGKVKRLSGSGSGSYDTDATLSDGDDEDENHEDDEEDEDASPSDAMALDPPAAAAGPKCAYVADCPLRAPPRRIVSHYFGRNKKETRAIPDSVWVFYCRQHYQRAKYRQRTHVYALTQMELVRQTVANLEQWGGVTDFAINLRKRAIAQLRKEDASWRRSGNGSDHAAAGTDTADASPTPCDERWLLPFVGPHKTFSEVYDVIARVAERSRVRQCPAAEFELVPNIKPQHMRRVSRGV